jgi:hypothetical protein
VGSEKYGVIGVSQFASSEVPEPVYDLTPNVYKITINRGRNIQRDTYESGTAVVRVLDPDSLFNPQNVASPFFGFLTPLRKIRISATTDTANTFLFSGYTTEYRYSYPTNQETAFVDIYVADAFRLFQLASVSTVAGANTTQATGTRIGKILDQMSFPNNMRTVSTGNALCQADPATVRTGLDALKNVEFSEQGAFYIDGNGTAIFKSRDEVVSSIAGDKIQFNQESGIPYKNLVFAFDDKLIINSSSMTRVGGVAQTYVNAASVAKYFPHQQNQTNLVIDTDAAAANIAATYVATRQATTIRIDAMTLNLLDPAVPTDTIIGLEYFSNLRIRNVQPDGSEIVKDLQCQGLAWEITPQSMQCTVTTLEPITEGFVIGYGIIGETAMTY